MFSHVMVGANDIAQSRAFYDAVLGAMGAPAGFEDDLGRVFWATPTGVFAISRPINGEAACGANGGTVGFAMSSPEQADAWHAAGVASGGTTCEDAPGWRESAMGRMYLAYLRDPAGNKLCALHRPA
ncbi:VOC family protein [Sphingomonas jatrophae]|uniref:Catechol 2,3-dioxygenase n=1 Tax=Sphingomonas jatrophae TaxID=1166337 RepID=A0A1I6JKQ3_9SPHN|nr:VOC family protein [Sphingomonas jatrophae]SFR79562.1 Catechol 2,3-dioxygenase [Sphingomonas jatrophae]